MVRRQVLEMVGVALLAMVGFRADAGDARVKAVKPVSACCCGDTCCCGDACKDACCCGPACCGETCCCDTAEAATAKTAEGHKVVNDAEASCCTKTAPAGEKVVR